MFWLKILCIATVTLLVRAQLWDVYYDDYDEEEEAGGNENDMFGDEYYIDENATYVLVMSSSQIRRERELYNKCNDIIMDEVEFLLDYPEPFDTENVNMTSIDELIVESSIELFNILQAFPNDDELPSHRIRVNDIFIWSNVSESAINELLEEYYNEGGQ